MTAESIRSAYPFIEEAIKDVEKMNPDSSFAAIVVGSAARGTETHRSDVDLLLVSETPLRLPRFTPPLHVQCSIVQGLRDKVRNGDDFVAWAVRLGVPIKESEEWRDLCRSNEATTWPNWQKKIEHSATRLLLSSALFRTGDIESAAEEMIYSASHAARALLLQRRVFPLSKGELPEQLSQIGFKAFSAALSRLIRDEADAILTGQMIAYVKRLLCWMDRNAYSAVVTAHRIRARQKKRPDKLA